MDNSKRSAGRTVYFAVQTRFHRDSAGAVRTNFGYARREAWLPYLEPFARVVVIGRVSDVVSSEGSLVEGEGISVMAVPFFHGPRQILSRLPTIVRFLKNELRDENALYGARFPNLLGSLVGRRARALNAPFVAQLVGDPEEVLLAGAGGGLWRMLAPVVKRVVARDIRKADAVIYVTKEALQAKYPANRAVPVLIRSNVELSDASFVESPRDYGLSPIDGRVRLFTAGSQEQLYKGHQTLVDATQILRERGIEIETVVAGGGRYHDELIARASDMIKDGSMTFLGHLENSKAVRAQIRNSDLFVMPSLTEGLPRVLIEAMASGIACVGSRVGGIPELLPARCLFKAGSAIDLADVIESTIKDPQELTLLAQQNFEKALEIRNSYSGSALLSDFLCKVVEARHLETTHHEN